MAPSSCNTSRTPAITLPLTGSHLIEASAGTGKTFTIAMLYLRLILGHGDDLAFSGGALMPPDILVVTFTEAATKELRERIRARLSEAARFFREGVENTEKSTDELLILIRADYPENTWASCARKLELAAQWMDEAAISTIHAWCLRMLREHAFDSKALFQQELNTNTNAMRLEVLQDYWRIFYYPLPEAERAFIKNAWKSPEALETLISKLIHYADYLPTLDNPIALISESIKNKNHILETLKKPWGKWANEIRDILDNAREKKLINGQKLKQNYYADWLLKLKTWSIDPNAESLELSDSAWHRLTREGLIEAWKIGEPPPHPAFDDISRVKAALDNLPDPTKDLLCHAAKWIDAKMRRIQQERAAITFDSLLTSLATALQNSESLIQTIRKQFPVALVDEFQDTDPVQYEIFNKIYAISENRKDSGLILIGDPKQAIYAFRGADIYTYLQARKAVGSRIYTLSTNYRSSEALMDAINHVFSITEENETTSGAFRFRQQNEISTENPVPFIQQKAAGRKAHLEIKGDVPPALILKYYSDDKKILKTNYLEKIAGIAAAEISAYLVDSENKKTGFVDKNGFYPLKQSDIAVLVNNGREAKLIQDALAKQGLRSVYLSDKALVYSSQEATEIAFWLRACAEPENALWLRAALATPTLGLPFAKLDVTNRDEVQEEAWILQFKNYRLCWQQQGVLPMLRRLLQDFDCHHRLLSDDSHLKNGERTLTNLLHLAELLQEASTEIDGEHALIRFFSEERRAAENGDLHDSDAEKLRLESESDLIKVVTIHKAKGLEYPLVFLPFLLATRETKKDSLPFLWHDAEGKRQFSLNASPEVVEAVDAERLSEDIRKTYVALTRARHLTWIGMAAIENNEKNALNYLFNWQGGEALDYRKMIETRIACTTSIALVDVLEENSRAKPQIACPKETRKACRIENRKQIPWHIGSYSALRFSTQDFDENFLADSAQNSIFIEESRIQNPLSALSIERDHSASLMLHHFPRGSLAGTFLHSLLEAMAAIGFSKINDDNLRYLIQQKTKGRDWENWNEPLFHWLSMILVVGLEAGTEKFCLKNLLHFKSEMAFHFSMTGVDIRQMDAAITAHTLGARARPPLWRATQNGIFKGFIDLVFQAGDRYYLLDYKSNVLGDSDADYGKGALDEAIRAHRYDVQYVLYLFALHRLLKSRLPDYDYDRHMGGAIYFFLRGLNTPHAGVHFECPPKSLMDTLDRLFVGEKQGGLV